MDICNIKIKDDKANVFFREGYELFQNGKQNDAINFIDNNRLTSNYIDKVKVAFYYLAGAKYYYEHNNKEISGEYFHKAGHLLKYTNYINQAANAYARAGFVLKEYYKVSQDIKNLHDAVRSFAQSKNCFYDVGNSEDSEKMYIEEQKTKIDLWRSQGKLERLYLRLWQLSSNFGTSFLIWSCWVLCVIISFSFLYEYLYQCKSLYIGGQGQWHTGISAIYFSIVTISTLGYGDIVPITRGAQLVVIFNIIFGYLLLGLGIGIITRKIKGH